jgi:hypothetical protein
VLSISLRVEVICGYEDCFWKAINLRQRYASTYDALTRSTIQQIFELVKFRDEFQPGSRKEIAEAWTAKVTELGTALIEKMDFAYVDSAIKIHDRMLCYPEVFKCIRKMDMEFGKGSCLNYIRVLELICMKGKEVDQLWMLNCIADYIFTLKEYTNRDLSTRTLQGSPNNRGLLDMFLAKRRMMLWLADHLNGKNIPSEWVDVLKSLQTHAEFRSRVDAGERDNVQPDQSWLGTEHEIVRLAVDIMKAGLL